MQATPPARSRTVQPDAAPPALKVYWPPLQVRNARYSALIEGFTSTTYAMVIVSDPTIQARPRIGFPAIRSAGSGMTPVCVPSRRVPSRATQPATTLLNIEASRAHFESLINNMSNFGHMGGPINSANGGANLTPGPEGAPALLS